MKTDCIFCKIVAGKVPATVVGENKNALAFETIAPVAEHHVLVIPKLHIESFLSLEREHADILIEMSRLAQKVISDKKISSGFKLIFNGGKYQSVKHIHWHLLGGILEDEDDILNKT